MANHRQFGSAGGNLLIEVSGQEGASGEYSGAYLDALRTLARTTASQIQSLPQEQRPTELEVSYGLKALDNGGFSVGIGNDVNFRITMKWKSDEGEGGGLLGEIGGLAGGLE